MRRLFPLVLMALALPALALAQPADVPLPRERPDEEASSSSASSAPSGEASSSSAASSEASSSSEAAPAPPLKGPDDYQVACPAVMNGEVEGKLLPPIHEGQCGIQSPYAIKAINANGRSIALNAPVITDCGMASALPAWIAEVDSYLRAHDKTGIRTIGFSTSYQCRNVDHAKEGNLSFHAFADALDLVGFTLEDGRTIDIKSGWSGTPEQGSQILHFVRDAACTHFMTVLGPEADSYHQDNLHIDLACHGKMCTARLCE